MPSFAQRATQKELLDGPAIPFADIRRNMQELEFINRYLGGHAISISGLQSLFAPKQAKQTLRICEIGCGGGDNLKALNRWCRQQQIEAEFIGVDINPECIAAARSAAGQLPVNWICSDYRQLVFENRPDILFSSLFCHHFSSSELVDQLQWLQKNARIGFFINDLHRHPLAYYSIRTLTRLFSRSYLVKNDAPLSVLRGFQKKEWQDLLEQAGINNFSIRWKWAFRWLLVVNTQLAGGQHNTANTKTNGNAV